MKKVYGIPVLAFVLGVIVILAAAGMVFAAMDLSWDGSVTVAPPNPSPSPQAYTFKAWDAQTGGNEISNAFWALGSISSNGTMTKTLYLENTGNSPVDITASVSWTGSAPGNFYIPNLPATLPVGSARLAVPVTFSAGANQGSANFNIQLHGNP